MSNLIEESLISRCDVPMLKPGLFYSLNVRLQARAACGASLCEPLFGGT